MGGSFRQAGLQCIAVRVCGAMCQTLAIYMDCFVACVCVCATLVCTTYACWQRTRATPSKFRWLGASGASKGVLNNARATRSQRSSPRSELPCSPTWANVTAMATIASNSGKKNKHKTNDHDSNSNQKNVHNSYEKDNGHDSNSKQKNVHNQYQKDNDSSKIRQVTEMSSQVRRTGHQRHKCDL